MPNVVTFDDEWAQIIFRKDQGRDALVLFTNDENPESSLNKKFNEVAGQMRGQIMFVRSGTKEGT